MKLKYATHKVIPTKYEEKLIDEFMTFIDNLDVYTNYVIAMTSNSGNVNKANIHTHIHRLLTSGDGDPRRIFSKSFIWISTEEGNDFWKTVESKWSKYISVLLESDEFDIPGRKINPCNSIW